MYWLSLGAISLACLGMYLLTARPGSFGESAYIINRVGLAARGLRPYLDFEFAYGAGLLYGPLLLGKALHLGYVNGYYFFWLLSSLAGVWLLRFVVESIDFPGIKRSAIFLMLFWILLVATITTGTNYSGLRFLAAPALALLIYQYLCSGRYAKAATATWVAFILLLLLSPEFAIGFVGGLFAYMLLFWSREHGGSWIKPYSAALAGIAVVLWWSNRLGIFHTLRTFAQGGISLPIVPAAHILFLFFVVILAVSYLVSEFLQRRTSSTACLILISLTALPSALGHCDPGHVVLNSIPLIIVAFLWSSTSVRRWRWMQSAFVFLLLICTATFLAGYAGQLLRTALVLRMRLQPDRASELLEQYRQRMVTRYGKTIAKEKISELQLMSHYDATGEAPWHPPHTTEIVQAPFGYPFIQDRTSIDEGYYSGTVNAFSPEQIAAKIDELKQHPERDLLISSEQNCFLDVEGQRRFISILFFYPFRWRVQHPESLYNPVCRYISENYSVRVAASPDTYGFTLWSPKAN
jgi:hypothetical protein